MPNSQTWLGLLAAEPIPTSVLAGSGLGEVVHDEPFQLASSSGTPGLPVLLKTQRSEPDRAVIAFSPRAEKLDGSFTSCHEVPLKCSRTGPLPTEPATHTSVGESAATLWKTGVPFGADSVALLEEVPLKW